MNPQRAQGIARLKLALKIGMGGYLTLNRLTPADLELLQLETNTPIHQVLDECAEIVFAWLMELVPDSAVDAPDWEAMAVALLEQMVANRGGISYGKLNAIPESEHRVMLELLGKMTKAHLIVESLNGFRLGKFAEKALNDWYKTHPVPENNDIMDASKAGDEVHHEEDREDQRREEG